MSESNKLKQIGVGPKSTAATKPNVNKPKASTTKKTMTTHSSTATTSSGTGVKKPATTSSKTETKKIQSKVGLSVDIECAAARIETAVEVEEKKENINIALKDIADTLFDDAGGYIANSKQWPVIIDNNGNVGTFLKYRDVNYIDAFHPANMELDRIRLALLGGIRFGKPVLLDLRDNPEDMWRIFCEKCKEIKKELINDIISWEILSNKYFKELIRDGDDECYSESEFSKAQIYELNKNFKFFLLSTATNIPQDIQQAFITIVVS